MPRLRLAAGLLSLVSLNAFPAHADDTTTVPLASAPSPWAVTFATETRYCSWQSTRGYPANGSTTRGSGYEIYTPFALQLTGNIFKDRARSRS